MMLLSTIIQTFEAEFLAAYQNALLPSQRKALAALKQCRTTQSLGDEGAMRRLRKTNLNPAFLRPSQLSPLPTS